MEIEGSNGETVRIDGPQPAGAFTVIFKPHHHGDSITVARLDPSRNRLEIYPKRWESGSLVDQYDSVKTLIFKLPSGLDFSDEESFATEGESGFLLAPWSPPGFARSFASGLGLIRKHRGLIHEIEKRWAVDSIEFIDSGGDGIDGTTIRIPETFLSSFLKEFSRFESRVSAARSRVAGYAFENAARALAGEPPATLKIGRNAMINTLAADLAETKELGPRDAELLSQIVHDHSRSLAKAAATGVASLRRDLELVSLEDLVARMGERLSLGKRGEEEWWQNFFAANTFALKQIFSAPLEFTQDELHLRFPDSRGSGARIVDFAFANPLTKTLHLVEIKTPGEALVASKPYRGKGNASVYPPHANLVGAVAQLQSQLESARTDFPAIAQRSGLSVSTDQVRGCLVVGKISGLEAAAIEGFERYRRGLAGIEVVTFDELHHRLQMLKDFLSPPRQP